MGTRHDHPNDSTKVRALLQPDIIPPRPQMEGRPEPPRDDPSRDGTSQAASPSSPLSSPASPFPPIFCPPSCLSCTGDEGLQPGGGNEQREQGASSSSSSSSSRPGPDDLKQSHTKLGPLTFSSSHAVLIEVSLFNFAKQIVPQEGRDVWHSDFVKMPCSPSNVITVKSGPRKSSQVRRWELISKQLKHLASKKEVDVKDVEDTIIKINPSYNNQWLFDALYSFVESIPKEENYFYTLIPKMAALALSLPEHLQKAVPLLQRGRSATITMSQLQISCLLANAFFCTFPHRNTFRSNAEYRNYPSINFSSLFRNCSERKKEKLRAIMHYFNVVTDAKTAPQGLVTFERRSMGNSEFPNWRSCNETMSPLRVVSEGTIETDGVGLLQLDFASSWIGGGVLGSGLVQEEILFLMNPELIVSRLFTERLADNECLLVTGSQRFSQCSGFGDSFEWAGPHTDDLERDEWCRLQRQILAIDALNFKHSRDQYNMRDVTRELNKAYCGFKGHGDEEPDIATGRWGCGIFNGDPQLKAVIQQMAAAKAKRGLVYFAFGDEELTKDLQEIYHLLVKEGVTIERLYGLLEDYCAVQLHSSTHVPLLQFLTNTLTCQRSQL